MPSTSRSILWVGVLAALAAAAPARAGWRLPFAVLGPDQGLPSGQAISIAQTPDGFLWLGTENGVVRYEGGHHRRWTVGDGLPSVYVARVVATADGVVWLGTNRGLARLVGGRVEPVALEGAGATPVAYMEVDAAGRVWLASGERVYAQTGERTFRAMPWEGRVTALHAAPGGAVHVAGAGRLRSFQADGSVRALGPAEGLPPDAIRVLAEDAAGRLWAGAGRTLVVKEPGATRFADRSRALPAPVSPNGVAFRDRDGSVWLPTTRGALHLRDGRPEVLDAAHGLPFGWVRTVFRDAEGTLWFLGPTLARLLGEGRLSGFTEGDESSGRVVWFVARDASGRLVVGTDEGAGWVDPGGWTPIPGTEERRIKAVAADRGGTLWLVSTTGPASWLRPGARRAEPAPLGERGTGVNHVLVDSGGTVWLSHSREGVLRWDPAASTLVPAGPPELAGRPTYASGAAEDAAGRLWVGSYAGLLVRERDGRWRTFGVADGLASSSVRGATPLADGTAWLFYDEPAGLTRVRLHPDRLEVLEHRRRGAGLASDVVYAAREGPRGHLWVTTDQGLDRLDPPLHLGRLDGMTSEDCSLNALLVEGGVVWVGTSGGLVRHDAPAGEAAPPPPVAHVLSAELGGVRLAAPFGELAPVPPERPTARFRVGAPSFARERALRFRVRLTGVEDGWRDVESLDIRYGALPPGLHRFEVRASLDGRAWGPVAALAFRVVPPWWRTWWATALWALLGLLALSAVVRLRVASLARSKAALERLVEQRTAELRERNDELTRALSEVKELSGLLPICMHCKRIRDDQGYWEKIEKYLSVHTRANFTHGLCPECLPHYLPPE